MIAISNRNTILILFAIFLVSCAKMETTDYDTRIKMTLSANIQKNAKRELPRFNIRLTNVSTEKIELLKLWNRGDLQLRYIEFEIYHKNKLIEPYYLVSDPGSISKDDYQILTPQESVSFDISVKGQFYKDLEPGEYYAIATMRNRLPDYSSFRLKSNAAYFTIDPR